MNINTHVHALMVFSIIHKKWKNLVVMETRFPVIIIRLLYKVGELSYGLQIINHWSALAINSHNNIKVAEHSREKKALLKINCQGAPSPFHKTPNLKSFESTERVVLLWGTQSIHEPNHVDGLKAERYFQLPKGKLCATENHPRSFDNFVSLLRGMKLT